MRPTQAVRVLIPIIKGPERSTLRTPALIKPPKIGTKLPAAITAASQALKNEQTPELLAKRDDISPEEKEQLVVEYEENQTEVHALPWQELRNARLHPLDVLAVRRAQEPDFPPNLRIERRISGKYISWKLNTETKRELNKMLKEK